LCLYPYMLYAGVSLEHNSASIADIWCMFCVNSSRSLMNTVKTGEEGDEAKR
jgi:hypothetical protein